MNLKGTQYQYNRLREQINNEIKNETFSKNIYESANGISRVIDAIVKTKGENWAAHVLDNKGNPVFTPKEQEQFTVAFQDYIDTILHFFGEVEQDGGEYLPNPSDLSGLSEEFLQAKKEQVTKTDEESQGVDSIYTTFINKIRNVDGVVNDYASKYGVLKLEKEHDLEPDIRLIPEPLALVISEGVMALSATVGYPILPNVTMDVLSKIKIPFRTIIFAIYVSLDVARISMSITGRDNARKILSILLSLLELLRGDWKKAILTTLGYFGTKPLLYGEIGKIFITSFRMFSPDLQETFVLGSLDAGKSFIIGILLSIFQVTAPEEVRLPLIAALEKIARRKAEINGVLEGENLSARPDYLSPTYEDLQNIQAVMTDPAYLCSCEFHELVKAVDKTAIIRTVLELLRIPVSKEAVEYKCGKEECKPFVTRVVEESQERKIKEPTEELIEEPTEELIEEPTDKLTEEPNENSINKDQITSTLNENSSLNMNRKRNKMGGRVLHAIGKFKKQNNKKVSCQ